MALHNPFITFLLLFLLLAKTYSSFVGVNYGRVANNLPTPFQVVQLMKSNNVDQIKLYDADSTVLRALSGTNIKVVIAMPNENLTIAAKNPSFAAQWIQSNVAAYYPGTRIQTIAVGNEVFVDPKNLTSYLVPAMQNVHSALVKLNLDKFVKVSSPIALTALQSSYPSSSGSFREDLSESVMKPMLQLLRQTGSYLMVNAYPFFAYGPNADVISLDYALFRPNQGVVDAGNGLKYYSLFDAQIDAVFAAMKKLEFDDLKIVVSETGWPSRGDKNETGAGEENAAAYNGNLVRRVLSGNAGTPLKADADMGVYLFALFNENMKPGPTSERNYGLFYPNEEKVYDIQLSLKGSGAGNAGLRWQDRRGRRNSGSPQGRGSNSGVGVGRVVKSSTGETWCVANAQAGKEKLQAALDYACGEGGADCGNIQPGADCYDPDTIEAHATYAFNSYYQKKGRVPGTCTFQGAAYVVSQSPKVGKCELPTRA